MSTLTTLQSKYLSAKQEYYTTGNTLLTDAEFDKLETRLLALCPDWVGLKDTGHKIGKKEATALYCPMPSLSKIQSTSPDELSKFQHKYCGSVHASAKLDGASIQAVYLNGKLSKLITRGDGLEGKDISYFIPYVTSLPKKISSKETFIVRCEAVMKNSVYEARYSGRYDSSRALASAVFNRQDISLAVRDLDFIALRILSTNGYLGSVVSDHSLLKTFGFQTPPAYLFKTDLTSAMLEALLAKMKKAVDYDLDGLVISSIQDQLPVTEDRPPYAKAFKVNESDSAQQAVITAIEWNVSSFGRIIPKAVISPIKFGNVTVKHAALHNAAWMIENKVGVGALVKVIRSGEIIPKIIEVVNGKKATLPSTKLFGEYEWDKTKTNLVCSGDNVEIQTRRMSRFFGKLGLDKIGSGFAEKLVAAGVAETQQAPKLSLEDIKSLPGIKSSAGSIYKELQRITSGEFTTVQLMDASGCFELGVGSTRLSALPKHLTAKDCRPTVADITAVPGLGTNFAEVYIAGFQKFNVWMKVCGAPWVDAKKAKSISGKLSGQNFSWTGYRSEEEENLVRSLGGSVVSFGSKTDVLFYTDGGKASSKVSKAGDKATTFKSFMNEK